MESGGVEIRMVEYNGVHLPIIQAGGEEFIPSRAAEYALYGSLQHCGSLNKGLKSCGQPSPILLRRKALPEPFTEPDYDAILKAYRKFVLGIDPTSTRQPKMLSFILVTSLGEVSVALRGNQEILEALGCDVPEEWQLQTRKDELEQDPDGPLVDLLIEGRLDELRELSIQAELTQFEPYAEVAEDEAKLVNYGLKPCRSLELQLNAYHQWKTKAYAWDRDATAVVEVTVQSDTSCLLRFLGFYQHSEDVTVKGLKQLTLVHPSKLQAYCEFLIARPVTHGTVSNYLNGLVNMLAYVQSLCLANDDSSDFEDCPDTVDALIEAALKLRSQAEKQAKVENLYKPRHPNWCSWRDAKLSREAALSAMTAKLQQRPFNRQEVLLAVEDALLIGFNTIMPPDRCGVIRRLCLEDTLKQQPDGSYYIDVTQFKHKTSRYYGPAMTPVSPLIKPILDKWLELTQSGFEFFEFGEEEDANRTRRRYIFSQRRDTTRCLESSAYTARFKVAFERHSPNNTATPPSLLRSAFITHMREHTADQEVLQSAATAMKHSLKMQSSDTYDLDTHIRATQAAMDFCHEFAISTETTIESPATPHLEQPQQSNADFDAIDGMTPPVQPTWNRQLPPTAAVDKTSTVAEDHTPTPPAEEFTPAEEEECEIRFPTAGEIVGGSRRHQILWSSSPEILGWWGELPGDYRFESAQLVTREVQIKSGRKVIGTGLIASIQDASHATVTFADGVNRQLDLMACQFKKFNSDQWKTIQWHLTRPETWSLDIELLPCIATDWNCDFAHSTKSEQARAIWLKHDASLFPSVSESIAILEAVRATCAIIESQGHRERIETVLEWCQSNEPTMASVATKSIETLLGVYMTGSCVHDSLQVILSCIKDSK